MSIVSDIRSTNWQISTAGFGVIAEGLEDIRQCIDLILRTVKGSDSFRPEFGSDIYQYIDYPVNVAVANIKRCILEAVEIWETRVKIVSISHTIDQSRIYFAVTYQLTDQDILDSLVISAGNDGITSSLPGSLILQAFYPPNAGGRAYTINLVLDDRQAVPLPPAAGFNTLNGLFAWVQQNLGYLGRWQQMTDRFVLYLTAGYATSGSVSIELLATSYRYQAELPALDSGQVYTVRLDDSSEVRILSYTQTATKDALRLFMQQNYQQWGLWDVIPGSVDIIGDFNAFDFSSDFFIGGSSGYYLVLTSGNVINGVLNVTANG